MNSQLLEPVPAAAAGEPAWQQGDHSGLGQDPQQQQQQQQPEPSGAGGGGQRACNGAANPGSSSSGPNSRRSSSGSDSCHVRLSLDEAADGSFSIRLHPGSRQQPASEQQQQQEPWPQLQSTQLQRQKAAAAAAARAEQQFGEVVGALLGLLCSDVLPPLSFSTLGWLLHQLLSVGKGGAALSGPQQQALGAAVARQRAAMQRQLRGGWCDALVPMVAAEWGRTRQAILRSGPGPVHVAVQTWMQASKEGEGSWAGKARCQLLPCPCVRARMLGAC